MTQVEVNAIRVNYELSGKADGPVVVLSHSLGSSLVMWEPQLKPLEARFRVLRYDVRGHGQSEAAAGPYTLEQLVEDAVDLLDHLGINSVHWVGLSMGGMIGLYLSLNYPERLQSLALCDTTAIIPKDAQPLWQDRIDAARSKGLGALVNTTMERWFTPSYLAQNHHQVEPIRRQFLATPVTGYIGCSEAIRQLNLLDRLPEIKTPTLIMVGEDDPGTPVSASRAMQERIGGSRLVVLPDAAHFSNVEQADAFNDALIGFLNQH